MSEMFRQKGLLEESIVHLIPLLKTAELFQRRIALSKPMEKIGSRRRPFVNWTMTGVPLAASKKIVKTDAVGIGFGFKPGARFSRLCGCASIVSTARKAVLCPFWTPIKSQIRRTSMSPAMRPALAAQQWPKYKGRLQDYTPHTHLAGFPKAGLMPLIQPLLKSQRKSGAIRRKAGADLYAPGCHLSNHYPRNRYLPLRRGHRRGDMATNG